MAGKLTIEYVKEQFEKEGYELLLIDSYVNNRQKLPYKCSSGHKHSIAYANWQIGQRCAICARNAKLNIDFIRKEFEKEKYILLTTKYKNAHQKLSYICLNGHRHSVSWSGWKCNGNRCPYCIGKAKLTINFVRTEFEKEGYVFLTKRYRNSEQKLKYICPNGHKHSIKWANWHLKKRCPTCYRINNVGSNHPCWKDGVSFEPYVSGFNKNLKKLILERDNYQCQNLDCWKTKSDDLIVHHIDYNKKNCGPSNLITLCRSCNARANFDREYWIKFYQKIMKRRNNNVLD